MKNSTFLLLALAFLFSCKEKEDKIQPETLELVSKITDSKQHNWDFKYKPDGRVDQLSYSKLGDINTFSFKYDSKGQIVESVRFQNSTAVETFTFTYNSSGNLMSALTNKQNEFSYNFEYNLPYILRYKKNGEKDFLAFIFENENITGYSCFDCPSIGDWRYTEMQLAVPKEFQVIWPHLRNRPEFFPKEAYYTKNIPSQYGALVTYFWIGELNNRFEFNKDAKPKTVNTFYGKPVVGNSFNDSLYVKNELTYTSLTLIKN